MDSLKSSTKADAKPLSVSRKGQTAWSGIALAVAGSVIAIAVTAIVLQAFRDSQTANTSAYNISNGGLTFLLNATNQFGTAGTILGVMLIVFIVGAFGFLGYQALSKRR